MAGSVPYETNEGQGRPTVAHNFQEWENWREDKRYGALEVILPTFLFFYGSTLPTLRVRASREVLLHSTLNTDVLQPVSNPPL